jgi:hypothetical protein
MNALTAAELAAFLGMTASGVRNVISRKRIAPIGKRGKANLYDSREVIRHAGAHDRLVAGTRSESVGH